MMVQGGDEYGWAEAGSQDADRVAQASDIERTDRREAVGCGWGTGSEFAYSVSLASAVSERRLGETGCAEARG